MAEVFDELKRYVHFDAADERALRDLHQAAAPQLRDVARVFYDRILVHPEARKVMTGGDAQIARLLETLVAWLDTLLAGPWDHAYWERRQVIGRVHVRIGLPQHFMFAGMSVIRVELGRIAYEHFHPRPRELQAVRDALGKILDLELAVMLHTYRDDLLAQQARVERLSTFGQLVGSIGHDLRNPLGVIESSLYLLRAHLGDARRAQKHLDRIGEQVAIANGIVTNLLDMIRDRPLSKEPVRLSDVVEHAAEAVQRPAAVRLDVRGVEDLPPIEGDPGQLRQVLVNLLSNAVFAASPRGEVAIRGSRRDGTVELEVDDTGPGVDPATRPRLFEPLITTKRHGVGLGLALVKRIAERHGGSIAYSDRPGGGARFTLRLPAGGGSSG